MQLDKAGNPDGILKNRYYKDSEKASVGYYSLVKKDGVKVELTCSERVAIHRYTFPAGEGCVLANFQHGLRFMTDSLALESVVKIEDHQTISGYCHTKNWVERKYFFVIEFDKPFIKSEQLAKGPKENAPKYILSFNLGNIKDKNLILADIMISAQKAKSQSAAYGTTAGYELSLYACHGLLHILGYDDRTPEQSGLMRKKESQYVH